MYFIMWFLRPRHWTHTHHINKYWKLLVCIITKGRGVIILGIETWCTWIGCFIYIEAGMASLSSWKKKKSAIRLDVWGLTVPKIWFFGGTFWDLCQTESAACFIPLWFYAREDTFEFQNQTQKLHFMCFSYSGRRFICLCSSLSPFSVLLSSCLYVILKTLLRPNSHVQLPVLHKFWTDAISEWGRKYTGILFLMEKFKGNIANSI